MKNNFAIKDLAVNIFDFFINFYFFFFITLFITDYSFILSPLNKRFSYLPNDISNISVQTIVLAFLLLIRWFINKNSFQEISFIRVLKRAARLSDSKILIAIFITFLTIFLAIGIARHWAFSSAGYDLGVYDHSIWNTTKGDILFSSLDGNISHLGAHFEPVLILIAPLYLIWPNAIVLIILQALALGLAIFPLYLIAKNKLGSRLLVFAFIFAYCLSRSVRGVGLLDFHPDSFLVPLIFFCYYCLITKRTTWALVSIFLMLLCKEDVTIIVAGLGIFVWFFQKRYKFASLLLLISVLGWLIETNLIIPHFANTKNYSCLSWLPFGQTYAQNINAVINKPSLLKDLFFGPGKINFYVKLFGPLGFISFLSPQHFVLFLLPLLEHILGSIGHPGMQTISSHYPAHTMPFIFIAAISGASLLIEFLLKKPKWENKRRNLNIVVSIYIILFSLLFFGKSDGHKFAKFIKGVEELRAKEIILSLRVIPADASVFAVNRLIPSLSHRKYIYIWKGLKNFRYNTEYVVLHRDLLDKESGQVSNILYVLNQQGYKNILAEKDGPLYILFNEKFDRSQLENEPKKLFTVVE